MASEVAEEKNSSILQVKSFAFAFPISNPSERRFFMAQIILRILATAFTLIAICVMFTSSQSVVVYEIEFEARYNYSPAFKFLVVGDTIACAFSLLSVIFVYILGHGSNPRNYFFIFLHDIVILVLVISGCAAATAIGYVGRYGQTRMGWMAICGDVGKFCNRVSISVVFSFLGFLSFLVLTVTSATQVYSYCINCQKKGNTTQGR